MFEVKDKDGKVVYSSSERITIEDVQPLKIKYIDPKDIYLETNSLGNGFHQLIIKAIEHGQIGWIGVKEDGSVTFNKGTNIFEQTPTPYITGLRIRKWSL